MLYNIILPIIIVLSLSGIVYILMRKTPQMTELAKKEVRENFSEEKKGILKRIFSRLTGINWSGIKNWFLSLMEKIMRRLRLVFLKLENSFKRMSDWLRTRKTKSPETKEEIKDSEIERPSENIMPKIDIIKEEEKPVRPIISDKIVSPRDRTEMKDRLEELLIERIAADPRDVEAYERLAEYYFEVGNYEDAKECYKQVIKLDPKNRNVRYKMRRLERIIGM
jgi:tetratricopeptide (TPR) repeat protein